MFVLTRSQDGVKGSGRSIETYSMFEEMSKCKELYTKYGGHPMAAGVSIAGGTCGKVTGKDSMNCVH